MSQECASLAHDRYLCDNVDVYSILHLSETTLFATASRTRDRNTANVDAAGDETVPGGVVLKEQNGILDLDSLVTVAKA